MRLRLLPLDGLLHRLGNLLRRQAVLHEEAVRISRLGVAIADVDELHRDRAQLGRGLGHHRSQPAVRQVLFRDDDAARLLRRLGDGVPVERLTGLADSVEAPRFATVVGLAQYGANRIALGAGSSLRKSKVGTGVAGTMERIKFWLQDFF